jgi:alpha-D-ribose 1-methylphosphonate 5-triphosphate diphosphatase PhnM
MGSNLGTAWDHLFQPPNRKLGGKHAECRKRCWPSYQDCVKQNAEDQAKAAEFPTVDSAIDWVKRHHQELLVGAIVVIAGVAFVVAVAGSGGLLVLAPVVLLVSSDAAPEPSIVAGKP